MFTNALFASIIIGCGIPVVTEESTAVPYRTEHFAIYYDPDLLSTAQIETIALRKEEHYARINDYLDADYNGVIEAFLGDTIRNPSANMFGQIYETYSYALDFDDGHEIAHVISFEEWGYAASRALREGIAVAAQYYDTGTAFTTFKRSFHAAGSTRSLNVESMIAELRKDFCDNPWSVTSLEYARAGAFLQFLCSEYGLDRLRTWYRSCIGKNPKSGCSNFPAAYGFSIERAFEGFGEALRGAEGESK